MPSPTACTASARLMAGPWVKSAVPAAMRQLRTPGTGSPAMPISTGRTSQWAVRAIWHTLVRRMARFSATARVTSCPVWLTPCATTPLSAQSTTTTRRERSSSALLVKGGGILQHGLQPAQPAQRLCKAGPVGVCRRAGSFVGRGDTRQKCIQFRFGHFGHPFVLLYRSAARTKRPRQGRARPVLNAGTPP